MPYDVAGAGASHEDVRRDDPSADAALPPRAFDEKYSLLLKYSDKARAAEARLASLPDDLRDAFRRQAVAEPARMLEIAANLLDEHEKRRNPFDDPELDTLHHKLALRGPEAQAEFRQVLGLLRDQIDPKQVYLRILDNATAPGEDDDLPTRSHRRSPVVNLADSTQAKEERRRRAAKIVIEIEKLRRSFEVRDEREPAPGNAPASRKSAFKKPASRTLPSKTPSSKPVEPEALPQDELARIDAILNIGHPEMGVAAGVVPVQQNVPEKESFDLLIPSKRPQARTASGASRRRPRRAFFLAAGVAATVVTGGALAMIARPGDALQAAESHVKAALHARADAVLQARADAALQARANAMLQATKEDAQRETAQRMGDAEALTLALTTAVARTQEAELKALKEKIAAEAAVQPRVEERPRPTTPPVVVASIEPQIPAQTQPQTQAPVQARPALSEAELRQQAEKAEAALNLPDQDRRKVQQALTALGHTVSATGYFGPITRSMITEWQKSQGLAPTGFLDASQLATLFGPPAGDTPAKKADAQPAPQPAPQPVPQQAAPPTPQQAEAALNLSDKDRRELQLALTALGHTVPATGYFGPITRSMITEWQKSQGLAETGFLDRKQLGVLQEQAVSAAQTTAEARKPSNPRSGT